MRNYSYSFKNVITAAAMVFIMTAALLASSADTAAAASKLKVSPKSKVMYVGDTVKLKSDKSVKWSVSKGKSRIKLVSKKGKSVKVKALKTGTAYVKAKRGKSVKKIKITVRSNVPASITASVNRNVICTGEFCIASISAVKPSYASAEVNWSTSNKSVASVSYSGLVTGIRPGTVTITATSALDSSVRSSVTVYVTDVSRGTVTANVSMTDPEKYPAGKMARLWIPLPSSDDRQTVTDIRYDSPKASIRETLDAVWKNKALYVEWDSDTAPEDRTVTLSFHVERRGAIRPVNLAALEKGKVDTVKYAAYLGESSWSGSLDSGIVRETADKIVKDAGAVTVYDKAYAIYDWVLEHLTRDSSTPGLGKGDVEYILTHMDGGIGKCTDVNSVFDALCRAEGIPARGIFGMKFSTHGQKCKPQFLLPGYGWVDADPSEVLKQIIGKEDEYRGENAQYAEEWARLKDKYWGGSDSDWFMFSEGRDITLDPPQDAAGADDEGFLNDDGTLNYFVFPYGEYDGQYIMSHNRKLFPSYSYGYEEDDPDDCGC